MKESSGNKQRDPKKDLGILFVVAGCPGSGKSTTIKCAYANKIPIFGEKYHQVFQKTCDSNRFKEYKIYKDAKENGSI